jgi:hypothetical protein
MQFFYPYMLSCFLPNLKVKFRLQPYALMSADKQECYIFYNLILCSYLSNQSYRWNFVCNHMPSCLLPSLNINFCLQSYAAMLAVNIKGEILHVTICPHVCCQA